MGLKFFVYLDDAFGSHLQEDFRRPVAFIDRKVLIFPVSFIGKEKSQRVPIHVSDWLGFAVCTICFTF